MVLSSEVNIPLDLSSLGSGFPHFFWASGNVVAKWAGSTCTSKGYPFQHQLTFPRAEPIYGFSTLCTARLRTRLSVPVSTGAWATAGSEWESPAIDISGPSGSRDGFRYKLPVVRSLVRSIVQSDDARHPPRQHAAPPVMTLAGVA